MEQKKYDIFVSYSRKDIDIVRKLVNDIHAKSNARCWVDWNGIESGEQFVDVIINAIDKVDTVLFILSDNSMSSEFAKKEIDYARHSGKKIIPVVVDGGKLRGWFLFIFGSVDYIDINSLLQYEKLIRNITEWFGVKDKKLDEEVSVLVRDNNYLHEQENYINGHEYVDLGLPSGLKWATCNVGATEPKECGCYFSWGDVEKRKRIPLLRDDDDDYTPYMCKLFYAFLGRSISGTRYDVARKQWGDNWRMPSRKEFNELADNCRWVWMKRLGYKIIGPNGRFIILPAAGYKIGYDVSGIGEFGRYWTATPTGKMEAFCMYALDFDEKGFYVDSEYYRLTGLAVRPVCD